MHLFCLYPFPLIFTNININLSEKKVSFFVIVAFENCFCHWQEGLFQTQFDFFGNVTLFYFSYLFFIDTDIIENHVHLLYAIVDGNQEFFSSLKTFCLHKWKITKNKDSLSVNMKSKNGKI